MATIGSTTIGDDWVTAKANRSVPGLTGTNSINTVPANDSIMTGQIRVIVQDGTASHPGGRVITGSLNSSVPGFAESNVGVTASETVCNYASSTNVFTCFIPSGAVNPKMILGNLDKR